MKRNEETNLTKEQIVKSAAELFAKKGYNKVTHRELAKHGNFNSALINYYFTTKENLYESVFEYAKEISFRKHLTISEKIKGPEERITEMVASRLRAVLDDGSGGWFPRLINHAMSSDLLLKDSITEKYITPTRDNFLKLIAEYLESPKDSILVRTTVQNLTGHFIVFNIASSQKMLLYKSKKLTVKEKDELINCSIEYIRGALRHLKNKYKK